MDPIFQGKDGPLIPRCIQAWTAQEIGANLRSVFADEVSAVPLEVLANYLDGAQVALLHRLRRAAICDAFGISEEV